MAKVTLGDSEFDADNEEMKIRFGRAVALADCVALSARMSSGEISRLKKLWLVGVFYLLSAFCFHVSLTQR